MHSALTPHYHNLNQQIQYLMERVHSLLDPTTPQIVVSSCLEGKFENYLRFTSRHLHSPSLVQAQLIIRLRRSYLTILKCQELKTVSFTMKYQLLPGSLHL